MASASGSSGTLEERMLTFIKQHKEGASQPSLDAAFAGEDLQARVEALNRLIARHRVSLFQRNSVLTYKEADPDAVKLNGLNGDEILVYQAVKAAQNTGVWTKDLKIRTNLAQPQVTKILKTLEARKLVKAVKNIHNPSKKTYMLYELEPSREITGGAWYTENTFDAEFISVLREACFRYITKQGDCSITDLAEFIRAKGFSKVELRTEDVNTIVQTLVYDGRVQSVDGDEDDEEHFRLPLLPQLAATPFTDMPCGVCPVVDECHPGNAISPQTCLYFDKWLSF